ncbi:hypothetical protein FTUN_5682 [Frigoriglobus tundricola]|uniref:tRNA-modifying protein YgfZ n=1 Tax=Frigoriglobus tundricola TaxID=2774151 RepID=A0A6M5YYX2_9BACT|nr:hypothetical protein FTUN_5682 [Frigoriglobus tundricola]
MTPDYAAATTTAALFDTSAAAKLLLTGPDAPMFLGNLSTNDIKNLPLGGGCEAYFCDPRAKVKFQAWVYHVRLGDGRHAMWVETTPGRNTELVQYLDRYLISEQVEIADRTADFAQLHLAGPNAPEVLSSALGDTVPALPEFAHMERTFGSDAPTALAGPVSGTSRDLACSIHRRDQLGLPGFDLVCLTDVADGVKRVLTAAGATPGSAATFETLRIEAGAPVFGKDIDDTRFVMEVGYAPRAVSYAKGCFLGQEPIVMARDRAGHVNRAFLGLRVLDGGPLPAGTKLFRDGQEVGLVTSSCDSPRLGAPVALAYLKWKHQEPGTRMEAETATGKQAVEVLGLPPVKSVPGNACFCITLPQRAPQLAFGRTVSTGHGACRTTCSATLPSSTRARPPRPCVPMHTRSACRSRAAAMISSAGDPIRTSARGCRFSSFSAAIRCASPSLPASVSSDRSTAGVGVGMTASGSARTASGTTCSSTSSAENFSASSAAYRTAGRA